MLEAHIPDSELLLFLDGELNARAKSRVRAHLEHCWECRARRMEMDRSIYDFVHLHREAKGKAAPSTSAKARFAAHLGRQHAGRQSHRAAVRQIGLFCALAVLLSALIGLRSYWFSQSTRARASSFRGLVVDIPDRKLTPGAALVADRQLICSQPNVKNKAVSLESQQRVFREYGISDADPRKYEVDYLVTPAIGGVDDIRNLWPHSYSGTVWNAHVKDELEDRLRDLVCTGDLDLEKAQRDIATNWISAYKQYFHTDRPLP